ncbi:MAG TPA: hypothetical protein VGE52_12095 [Pirellulales bacterium]
MSALGTTAKTLMLGLLATIGCGGEPGAPHRSGGATVVETGGQRVVVADQGEAVAPPKSWPTDVPLHQSGKISMAQEGPGYTTVICSVPEKFGTVAEHYAKVLPEHGWKIQSSTSVGDASIVSAVKEKRTCTVSVGTDEQGSMLTLSITAPPPTE